MRRFARNLLCFLLQPRVLLCALLLFALSVFTGCRNGAVRTGTAATAPADPYATALQRLQVFAQVLQDSNTAAATLHTTYVVHDDGSTEPVLDDTAYARVQTALRFAASEGTTLSNLLAQRASGTVIATEMAKATTALAAQLAPDAIGVKNVQAQQRYTLWVNVINAAVNALALQLQQLIPTQESRLEPRGSYRADPVAVGARAAYPSGDRCRATEPAPVAAAGLVGAARPGERRLLARAGQLALVVG